MQTPSTPFALTPYGVSVFTDLKRGKSFVTLFYLAEPRTQAAALAFVTAVTQDLTRNGLEVTGSVEVSLRQTKDGLRCRLEVPAAPVGGGQERLLAFADALRASARKAGAETTDDGKPETGEKGGQP